MSAAFILHDGESLLSRAAAFTDVHNEDWLFVADGMQGRHCAVRPTGKVGMALTVQMASL